MTCFWRPTGPSLERRARLSEIEVAYSKVSGLTPVQQGVHGNRPNTFGQVHGLAPRFGETSSGRTPYRLMAASQQRISIGRAATEVRSPALRRFRSYDRTGV